MRTIDLTSASRKHARDADADAGKKKKKKPSAVALVPPTVDPKKAWEEKTGPAACACFECGAARTITMGTCSACKKEHPYSTLRLCCCCRSCPNVYCSVACQDARPITRLCASGSWPADVCFVPAAQRTPPSTMPPQQSLCSVMRTKFCAFDKDQTMFRCCMVCNTSLCDAHAATNLCRTCTAKAIADALDEHQILPARTLIDLSKIVAWPDTYRSYLCFSCSPRVRHETCSKCDKHGATRCDCAHCAKDDPADFDVRCNGYSYCSDECRDMRPLYNLCVCNDDVDDEYTKMQGKTVCREARACYKEAQFINCPLCHLPVICGCFYGRLRRVCVVCEARVVKDAVAAAHF